MRTAIGNRRVAAAARPLHRGQPTAFGLKIRRFAQASLVVGALLPGAPAGATSLEEALATAYEKNPQLGAARAQLRAVDEQLPLARAEFLPTVRAVGDAGRQLTRNLAPGRSVLPNGLVVSPPGTTVTDPLGVQLTVSQTVFKGGFDNAAVDRAEELVEAQRAVLLAVEQKVLLETATAFLNVLRDEAVLGLTENNERVLTRQLQAARDRLSAGEVTRTDVSQAEARLARASADRLLAAGQLNATRASFLRSVGVMPGQLTPPTRTVPVPATIDDVIAVARERAPTLLAARANSRAAEFAIDEARDPLLPMVAVNGQAAQRWNQNRAGYSPQSASVTARATVPIYEGGAVTSRLRAAKQTATQRDQDASEAERQAVEEAVRAWESFDTARASLEARHVQERAAETAVAGVRQESTVGTRTVLELLDAEQELYSAKVSKVRDATDKEIAAFRVLAAIGGLTAADLGLKTQLYDPKSNYSKVRAKLFGTDID